MKSTWFQGDFCRHRTRAGHDVRCPDCVAEREKAKQRVKPAGIHPDNCLCRKCEIKMMEETT